MAEFDPSTATVDEVLKKLEKADAEERDRILNAERAGKARVTILEPHGIDPDARVDVSGRVLYPWEVAPEEQTFAVQVDETPEARKAREAQIEFDEKTASATQSNAPGGDEQQGGTAPGVGTAGAPAAGTVAGGRTRAGGGTTGPAATP